jgi:branched-chain amino acid aminotransferase
MEFWIDGETHKAEDATIPVLDHGLLYGDGVFEGIRVYGGRPFYLDAHLDRLADSARALMLEPAADRSLVADACRAMGARLGDGYLRLLVTRGVGDLGLDPTSCTTPRTILVGGPIRITDPDRYRHGARLITSSVRRPPADILDARIKSLNYLPSILARLQARAAGADEALMLDHRGCIAEGSADNVLAIRGGVVSSPPTTDGGLDGITRAVVLELARRGAHRVRERSLTPFDLYTADEVLLTGTGAELIPVASVDGRALLAPGPMTGALTAAFRDHVRGLAAGTATEFDTGTG